jgi:hypothetical protein
MNLKFLLALIAVCLISGCSGPDSSNADIELAR